MPDLRLSRLLVLASATIGLAPLLLTGLIVSGLVEREMDVQTRSAQIVFAQAVSKEVELFLAEPARLLSSVALAMDGPKAVISQDRIDEYLALTLAHYPYFLRILALDHRGRVARVTPYDPDLIGLDLSRQAFFHPPAIDLQRWWSPPFISSDTGEPTLALSVRTGFGLLVGYIDLSFLARMTSSFTIGKSGYVILTDQNGVVLAHPDRALALQRYNISHLAPVAMSLAGRPGSGRYQYRGQDKIGTSAAVPLSGWTVLVTQPASEIETVQTNVTRIFWTMAALVSILVFILSLLFSRRVSRALDRLVQGTESIARGDYGTGLPDQPYREFKRLAESIEAMARAVQDREAAVKSGERNLAITLQSIGEGVVSVDGDGRIQRMNPSAEALLGLSAKEAVGTDPTNLLRLKDGESRPITCIWAQGTIQDSSDPVRSGDLLFLENVKENTIPVAVSGAPVVDNGHKLGAVWVLRDMTDRHRIEEQLRHSQKMETIGRLAGGVAHDFNNMVAGIMNAAEALDMKLGDRTDLSKYVRIIAEAAERAADLTRKLLDFSRKGKALSTPMDVHESVRLVSDILARSVDPGIRIGLDLKATASCVVGDPTQLQNALLNLALNARDAMPEGGQLTIATENMDLDEKTCRSMPFPPSPGRFIRIDVRDTGVGIEPGDLERIFEPFFSTKPVGQGTGLGLPSVYGMARDHGGAITVQSRPGSGSEFSLYLPVSEALVGRRPGSGGQIARGSRSGLILVVDDERMIREIVTDILEDLGFKVVSAENGRKAVEIYHRRWREITLVLMDLVMPDMNGREAFEAMQSICPEAKIVFASGFSHGVGRKELEDRGAAGFLSKPYKVADLVRMLDDLGVGQD
ncbi:MAG: response regulator [Deltaproteobacteria bacterium]|nr:response regulator [Deltaproteobacteria bacterium]